MAPKPPKGKPTPASKPRSRAPAKPKPQRKQQPASMASRSTSSSAGATAVAHARGQGVSARNSGPAQLGNNRLLNSTISPSRTIRPGGYPDTRSDLSHVFTSKNVHTFSSTADGEHFSLIASPNPASVLRYTQGDSTSQNLSYSLSSEYRAGFEGVAFPSSAFFGNFGTVRLSQGSGADAFYGGLTPDACNVRLRTVADNGVVLNAVAASNGKTFGLVEHSGSSDFPSLYVGASNPGRTCQIQAGSLTFYFPSTRTPVLSIYGFTSLTGSGTLIATSTGVLSGTNSYTFPAGAVGAANFPFLAVNLSIPAGKVNSVQSFQCQFDVVAVNANGYSGVAIPDYSDIVNASEDYRCIGLEMLVTDFSDALTNGGSIAISGRADVDAITSVNYDLVAGLVTAYDGPRKDGCWDFWRSPDPTSRPWRPYEVVLDDGFLVCAGKFGTAGGSMRVEVYATWEIRTAVQYLTPEPSRVHPSEILELAHILSALRVTGCANEDHENWRTYLQQFGDIITRNASAIMAGMATATELFVKYAPMAAGALLLL